MCEFYHTQFDYDYTGFMKFTIMIILFFRQFATEGGRKCPKGISGIAYMFWLFEKEKTNLSIVARYAKQEIAAKLREKV